MVLVKKKNGKLRVCVNYKKLNACTQKDHFLSPFITLLLEEVEGHVRYTFMHGYAGYNQIAIALQNIHKTAFTTLWGMFVWVVHLACVTLPPCFNGLLYKSMTVFNDNFSTQSNAS